MTQPQPPEQSGQTTTPRRTRGAQAEPATQEQPAQETTHAEDEHGIVQDQDVEPAPGAEPPEVPAISIGGPADRPFVERADRGTYISPPVRRNDDSDVPDEFVDMPDESTEVEGEPVEVFQVISSSGALALRLDGQVFILNPQQAQAFQGHIKAGLMNVVH